MVHIRYLRLIHSWLFAHHPLLLGPVEACQPTTMAQLLRLFSCTRHSQVASKNIDLSSEGAASTGDSSLRMSSTSTSGYAPATRADPAESVAGITLSTTHLSVARANFSVPIANIMSNDLDLLVYGRKELVYIAFGLFKICCPGICDSENPFWQQLLSYIEEVSYRYNDNSFHNFCHAVTVMHVSALLVHQLSASAIALDFIFALLLGALIHDVDHPGHNNNFEVRSKSARAQQYNNESVLEKHHLSVAFQIMEARNLDLLSIYDGSKREWMKAVITEIVMATDMARHNDLMELLKVRVSGGAPFSTDSLEDQKVLCKILLHAADLSTPTRPFQVAKQWSSRICDEMNKQADAEAKLGLDVAPYMRTKDEATMAKNESNFTAFMVVPMWDFLVVLYPQYAGVRSSLDSTLESWKQVLEQNSAK